MNFREVMEVKKREMFDRILKHIQTTGYKGDIKKEINHHKNERLKHQLLRQISALGIKTANSIAKQYRLKIDTSTLEHLKEQVKEIEHHDSMISKHTDILQILKEREEIVDFLESVIQKLEREIREKKDDYC